jgi:hypothetical protein
MKIARELAGKRRNRLFVARHEVGELLGRS